MDSLTAGVRAFLDHLRVERGSSPNTIAAYRRDLDRYLDHLRAHGVTTPDEVTPALAGEFAAAVTGGDGEHPPLAAASVARMVVTVRGLHAFWVADGLATTNPAATLAVPKLGRRLPKAMPVADVTAMIEAAGSADTDDAVTNATQLADRLLVELLYGTGARISEVTDLDVDDVTRVLADPDLGLRLIGKGDKERIVPLGSHARAAAEAYLVRGRPALAAAGRRPSPALLLNSRGARMSRQVAFNHLRTLAERAGLTVDVSPHTLRHSFATHMLDGGADVRVVQELLGHASVTTTQIYTLVTVEHLREVYLESHPRAR